jgi:hypothetical protein
MTYSASPSTADVPIGFRLVLKALLSGELPLNYLPLDLFLIVYFYSLLSSLSILYSLTFSTSTGSISSDCDCYGHSHVM